jgi:hypothetical protein
MDWAKYFEGTKGLGVLATADKTGVPNMAVYARPHVVDQETVAFIMRRKNSYANLTVNPKAAYLFREVGDGYRGWRLYLTKLREETDRAQIDAWRRKSKYTCPTEEDPVEYIVFFRIERVRPLIGDQVK